MTLSMMVECCYAFSIMLSVTNKLFMLSVIMQSVIILSVIMLNVMAPLQHIEQTNSIFFQHFFSYHSSISDIPLGLCYNALVS